MFSAALKLEASNCTDGIWLAPAFTIRQAENSEVLPCGSVAVQLTIPLLIPTGRSSGKLNCASPPALVITFGTLPLTTGRLVSWLVTHCASALKYQCTVNAVFGALFSVPFTLTVASGSLCPGLSTSGCAAPVIEFNTGKFCCKLAPPSVSRKSFAVTPALPRSIPSAPLAKTELLSMKIRTPGLLLLGMKTPLLPLQEIRLSLIVLVVESASTKMPFKTLPKQFWPVTSIPI